MSDETHRSDAPERGSKGLFHGLLTGPVATSDSIPITTSDSTGGRDTSETIQQHHQTNDMHTTKSQTGANSPRTTGSIFTKLFTPAPDPDQQEELKLLYDEDTRHNDDSNNNLTQISSTEASIQKLDTPPIPDDGGPQMIFETESSSLTD